MTHRKFGEVSTPVPGLDELLKWSKQHVDNMTPAQKAEMQLRQRISWVRGEMGISHSDWSEEQLNKSLEHLPEAWALMEIDRLRALVKQLEKNWKPNESQ